WREAVDPHLLPHLLDARSAPRGRLAVGLGLLGYVLAVLDLAGPSWRQIEQPLWQNRTPLVIALDLSSATLAGDLPPTRLAQARAKLATLLRERDGGQVGLVAYAGDAFTVAPLTDDAANVALFLDALHPQVMPVDGQRGDRAIEWSAKLLRQAGFEQGEILLLTDHADAAASDAAAAAQRSGLRVSVLGLGTTAGAPYLQPHGGIANARLDDASLRALARAGGGRYSALTSDDGDLRSLGVLDAEADGAVSTQGESGRSWQDEGYWLLLPLMLLALLAFRRGSAVAVLLVCLWLPWQPAAAAGPSAGSTTQLWRRPDQIAHQRMQQAAQAYRQGDFARAAQLYQGLDSADGHYNRGNALAKAGRYPQAIEAYDRALQKQPRMADAIANKAAVEAAMKRKPPPGPKQDGQQNPQRDGEQSPQDGEQNPGQDGQPSQQGPAQGEPDQAAPKADDATGQQPPEKSTPADAQAQQQADAAQRERMQRALEQAKDDAGDAGKEFEAEPEETPAERERRIANEAWLRRVPDDPGGLLRAKFRIEHERRLLQGGEK
ncbi:MAG TPA: VWA domain-containing protein, partial [Lysobacter sp.]|nr:VWA domain-containing protein [Lysobacter sp.]